MPLKVLPTSAIAGGVCLVWKLQHWFPRSCEDSKALQPALLSPWLKVVLIYHIPVGPPSHKEQHSKVGSSLVETLGCAIALA